MSDWTHVGSAAAVDEVSLDKFRASGGRLMFKGANTGWIIARCNVTNPMTTIANPIWNALEAVYRDQDGNGAAYRVTATLYRVSPTSGYIRWIGKFDSNTLSAVIDSTQRKHVYLRESVNLKYFAYFVQLGLYRANTNKNPSIYSVRLFTTVD